MRPAGRWSMRRAGLQGRRATMGGGSDLTTKRALLIVNRASGSAGADIQHAIERLRKGGIEVAERRPDNPSMIGRIIAEQASGADMVVVGGGDGTLSHSAAALLEAARPVGILPLGTANDFARGLGIPDDLGLAADIIVEGRSRSVDVGTIDGRPFLNVGSIGFSVEVARSHTGERKRRLRLLSYPVSWIDAYRRHRPFRARIICDGVARTRLCAQLAVGSGRHYGGGLTLSEHARIDDGWLWVYIVEPQGFWGWVRLLPSLRFGTIGRQRRGEGLRGRSVDIETRRPKPVNVDGELIGRTPARFRIRPGALTVFAPRTQSPRQGSTDKAGADRMSILRDEVLVALNALIVACREAANVHATAADLLPDGALASALSGIAQDRADAADAFAEAVIAKDDIPNAPSGEKELFEAAAAHVKAAISRDETRHLLLDCKAKEDRVADLATTVLEHEVEPEVERRAEALRADASSRLERLIRDHADA